MQRHSDDGNRLRSVAEESETMGKIGRIVQVIGPVVDVEFDDDHLPEIYNAIRVTDPGTQTLESRSTSSARSSSTSARTWCAPLPWSPPTVSLAACKPRTTGEPIKMPVGKADARARVERRRQRGRQTRSKSNAEDSLAHPSSPHRAMKSRTRQDRDVRNGHQGHRLVRSRTSRAARPASSAARVWARRC